MISRRDLEFATPAQIAGVVRSDWEDNVPDLVVTSLKLLSSLDDTDDFKSLTTALGAFAIIAAAWDEWQTEDSNVIKKEILKRIHECKIAIDERSNEDLGLRKIFLLDD